MQCVEPVGGTSLKTIAFEITGRYAHFRKFYAPVSPVTYSFPPPPTVLGLIGAICGYGKDEYAVKLGWQQVMIGVGLLTPVQKYRTGINLINTKTADRYFRPRGETPRIQIPYEFLKDVGYRIFVANASPEAMSRLTERLEEGKTTYTPSLGLAQCLAEVSFVGEYDAVQQPEDDYEITTVVAQDKVRSVTYEPGLRYERLRIPGRMDGNRVVHSYQEVIVEEGGNLIKVKTDQAYIINGETILFL